MKVFIDSNVLFSAALFPGSTPARALYKALTEPNDAIVCEINIDELKKVFKEENAGKDIRAKYISVYANDNSHNRKGSRIRNSR